VGIFFSIVFSLVLRNIMFIHSSDISVNRLDGFNNGFEPTLRVGELVEYENGKGKGGNKNKNILQAVKVTGPGGGLIFFQRKCQR
jgi:hypothetical protein